MPHQLNLASHFLDRNTDLGRSDRPALLGPTGPHTYADLADLTNRVGNVLLSFGVRPGDRVLLALSDGVEFVATWFGAQKIGAVTAEVYTFLTAKDYSYFLGYTGASVVVADSLTLQRLREAGTQGRDILVVGAADLELQANEHDFDALAAASPSTLDAVLRGPDDVVLWKFTTGSTGTPKACPHTFHSPVNSHEWYARGVLGLTEDDIVLPVPKLFFGYARDLAALFPFGVGGAGVVFPERSTPERVFALIAEHRPTVLVNVPTMMAAMVAHPRAAEQDLSSLRLCTSAGEALPPELHRKWDALFGVEVIDGIGSSEAYHIYISNRPGAAVLGSIGTLVPGYTARVVDPDGDAVPDGEVGTLQITGDTAATEYVGDPERSAVTFPGGGTVHTGDLVVRDPDGAFHYRGRADDLLKVSGIWVAPSEIEHCLIGHPAVVECAVLGHQRGGLTRPHAFVVSTGGVTEDDLRRYVRERLSPHKTPERVVFVAELPRTTNGKLDRRALRTLDVST
ncbi:benzoate-CoA ligase family protein [Actinokineospora diospyrosa]|uniref:Benzoate-CoA ligase n=1 Tax=Actinokineospora diospyrosa TaxID=103728 RepID=A0ABT1ILT4_9PSEU|nr:benzoate-CoA ligase family protein [Actinokineospora diospyrosa]MCP2273617.1 benzoate-CoA ligase (EC 6.2.1.25) [Actinokineospora diospyrosa]